MSDPRSYFVTAALPYSNNRLHVGHMAGAYVPADIYVRYLRLLGTARIVFVCGSDDHGVAALMSARQEGVPVEQLTSEYRRRQQLDFEAMRISFDVYGGTHSPECATLHAEMSQDFFRRINSNGFFTKRSVEQLFDPVAEQFLPDRFVKGVCPRCGHNNAYGDQCEACGTQIDPLELRDPTSALNPGVRLERRKTTHWFLKLDALQHRLSTWLESKVGSWRPWITSFTLGQVALGLPERSMTRDLTWGVPVPLHDDPDAAGKVLYVWFDAPIGYLSFAEVMMRARGEAHGSASEFWNDPDTRIVHFIGEDNVIFHTLTWPAMLMAYGERKLPNVVVANKFLDGRDGKISKSRTPSDSPVWVEPGVRTYGADALRFYLTWIAPESARSTFSLDDLVAVNNGVLVAAVGNFVHRTTSFAAKYFEGRVPQTTLEPGPLEIALSQARFNALAEVTRHLEAFEFRSALQAVVELARHGNRYFDQVAPFRTRKTDPDQASLAISCCLDVCRTLATLLAPFTPIAAAALVRQLGLEDVGNWSDAVKTLERGAAMPAPTPLFSKFEPPAPDPRKADA